MGERFLKSFERVRKHKIYAIMKLLIISLFLMSLSVLGYAQSISCDNHVDCVKHSEIETSGNDRSASLYFGEPEVIASGTGWVTITCNPPFVYICVWIHDIRDNRRTIIVNDGNYTKYEVFSDLEIDHSEYGTKLTFKSK